MIMIQLKDIIDFFNQKNIPVREGSSAITTIVTGGRNIKEAASSEITFLSQKYAGTAKKLLKECRACLVIVDEEIFNSLAETKFDFTLAIARDPKNEMAECLSHFFISEIIPTVHSTALIHATAKLGADNFIGAYTIIDENVW